MIELDDLINLLEETALKMRETSEEMRKMDQPSLQRHGSELRGASEMVEEWVDGITREIELNEISETGDF